jgi:hypothetical protein
MPKDDMSLVSTIPATSIDTINSPAMAISDTDSSELVEAVAALKVGKHSPQGKMPLPKPIQVGNAGGVDSGYVSHNGSERPSPDSLKDAFVDGGGVVGKPLWDVLSRKKIKLISFDKQIPVLTQNRFEDLRELHADSLNNLTRGLPRCRGILMSLKVLGDNESTAAPWVFIQCDKAVAGKVKRFFKQPEVESNFKPPHPNAYTPSFRIYVHALPPLALLGKLPSSASLPNDVHGHEAIEVYGEQDAISSFASLCGSQISVSTHGQLRSATFGGLIETQSKKDGMYQLFGITAGHFLAEEQENEYLEDEDGYVDDDEGFSDDDQDFELDLSSYNPELPPDSEQDEAQSGILGNSETSKTVIGHIYKTSQDDLQDQPNLDWALFTVENTSLYLSNVVSNHEISGLNDPAGTGTERKVVLATAKSGSVSGMLSKSWSYLMLAPGKSLVRVKVLTISNNKG